MVQVRSLQTDCRTGIFPRPRLDGIVIRAGDLMTRLSSKEVQINQFGSSILPRLVFTLFLVAVGSSYAAADENLTAEEQQALFERNMELVARDIEASFAAVSSWSDRITCNGGNSQDVIEDIAALGYEAAPFELFCPILLNETVNRLGGEGLLDFYRGRALSYGMTIDATGEGAGPHLLHLLHRGLSQPDLHELANTPGEEVPLTFTMNGRTFTVPINEETAFDIGYTTGAFNYSDPSPNYYFAFAPDLPGAGEPMQAFAQQLAPSMTEAELLALASQCYDDGQNHGVMACAAAGEVFATRSLGLPSPLTVAP